jgi:hypothetical protein
MTIQCPIAYDHTDDLDECAVCGWTGAEPKAPRSGQDVEGWIRWFNANSCCRPPTTEPERHCR